MKWISVKDKLPKEYKHYLVFIDAGCAKCDKNEGHIHRLNFKPSRIDIARWSEKDDTLIAYYHAQGDHSWDYCMFDHWSENNVYSAEEEITHWMPLPSFPEKPE